VRKYIDHLFIQFLYTDVTLTARFIAAITGQAAVIPLFILVMPERSHFSIQIIN